MNDTKHEPRARFWAGPDDGANVKATREACVNADRGYRLGSRIFHPDGSLCTVIYVWRADR